MYYVQFFDGAEWLTHSEGAGLTSEREAKSVMTKLKKRHQTWRFRVVSE